MPAVLNFVVLNFAVLFIGEPCVKLEVIVLFILLIVICDLLLSGCPGLNFYE